MVLPANARAHRIERELIRTINQQTNQLQWNRGKMVVGQIQDIGCQFLMAAIKPFLRAYPKRILVQIMAWQTTLSMGLSLVRNARQRRVNRHQGVLHSHSLEVHQPGRISNKLWLVHRTLRAPKLWWTIFKLIRRPNQRNWRTVKDTLRCRRRPTRVTTSIKTMWEELFRVWTIRTQQMCLK